MKINVRFFEIHLLSVTIFVENISQDIYQFRCRLFKKMWNASRFCVSSLRRGHANLLCIVPILVYVPPTRDSL
uniref:Uncharacterized protein n=1 Tax=Tetranychus urticae TaxID=32264 RepID=T1KXM5_TETUR